MLPHAAGGGGGSGFKLARYIWSKLASRRKIAPACASKTWLPIVNVPPQV
jgi:hypothetical protein